MRTQIRASAMEEEFSSSLGLRRWKRSSPIMASRICTRGKKIASWGKREVEGEREEGRYEARERSSEGEQEKSRRGPEGTGAVWKRGEQDLQESGAEVPRSPQPWKCLLGQYRKSHSKRVGRWRKCMPRQYRTTRVGCQWQTSPARTAKTLSTRLAISSWIFVEIRRL